MIVCRTLTLVLLCLILSLTGCQSTPTKSVPASEFEIDHLVKTDMDLVYDYQVKTLNELLERLMTKLYLRNPVYFRQYGFASAQARSRYFFEKPYAQVADQFNQRESVDLIQLAFDENFAGDRVAALVLGLKTMLAAAYNQQTDFFILDQLDPQKLYNAARNIEVAVWKLSHDHKADGQLFLVSNELKGPVKNLSFERLFGKMIAIQDSTAQFTANATHRVIKNVLQGVARFVFLPI